MENNNSGIPFNGQFPNLNMNEINGLMKQFSQLMEGDFWGTIHNLSKMQNMIPNNPGIPIMPMEPNRGEGPLGGQASAPMMPNFNFGQLNSMMERLNVFLNNDLMKHMYNLQSNVPNFSNTQHADPDQRAQQNRGVPIQIWENNQQIYVLASIPGLKNSDDVKVIFLSDTHVRLRAKPSTNRPERSSRMVQSDFPKTFFERDIELPQAVSTAKYSTNYKDGLYTLTLHKLEEEYEIPFEE